MLDPARFSKNLEDWAYQSSLLADAPIQLQVENAIRYNRKIRFQLVETPEFEFILFHPYAILKDVFNNISLIGLVERHHELPVMNGMSRIILNEITFVEILDVNFEPNQALWRELEVVQEGTLMEIHSGQVV